MSLKSLIVHVLDIALLSRITIGLRIYIYLVQSSSEIFVWLSLRKKTTAFKRLGNDAAMEIRTRPVTTCVFSSTLLFPINHLLYHRLLLWFFSSTCV